MKKGQFSDYQNDKDISHAGAKLGQAQVKQEVIVELLLNVGVEVEVKDEI